jgi:glycerol-3-phosphate dehydrogenase
MVPWRRAALDALGGETFDVAVVGGGINGAGIARDASLRGMRVAVLEQGDFASGTSSRSSKLIHGGLRYLEQGHVRLVREASREREQLRRMAPHLVRPMRFVFPLYRDTWMRPWMLKIGLLGYDVLAGVRGETRHRMLRVADVARLEPGLRQAGLRGAGEYWDCWTNDARLVLETMLSAAQAGAVALSYAEVVGFERDGGGRLAGVRVRDRVGGGEVVVRARAVVNAAGPWIDRVTALDAPSVPARLRLTKGVHVVLPRARIRHEAAIVLRAVEDGRVMFVIPWGAHSLVGTTDTDHEGGPDVSPTVEARDVAYLLDTVNHYFPSAALTPGEVVSAFAGLRPLIAPQPGSGAAPSDVSREEEIYDSPSGLVTIGGGKLTTYRLIAAKVVDRVVANLRAAGHARRFGPSTTAAAPFPGGDVPPESVAADLAARNGHPVSAGTLRHLADRYGRRADDVLAVVARDATLGAPILPALPDPRAEVVSAVEHEWAMTLEDVLRRRTQVALFDPLQGGAVAGDVAGLMAPTLGWDAATATRSADAYADATARERARWR